MSCRRLIATLVGIATACTSTGCRRTTETGVSPPGAAAWFEEIGARAGITFVHSSGHTTKHLLPEIMGGGAALFDLDNDGLLDLYLVQSGTLSTDDEGVSHSAQRDEGSRRASGNRLYRNRGDGTFEDVTERSGANVAGYGMGVTAGDFDNDGFTDLFVTNFGHNVLLRNDHGHLVDVTAKAGVAGEGWSTSAAFLDYDGDGALDLFVAHYLNWQPSAEVECFSLTGVPDYCSPASYDLPSASTLYHNNGDGTFTDVSARAGIRGAVGNGLGVVAGDFDGDGRIDVFVANDRTPNHLWLNQGGGRFVESALAMGSALDQDGTAKSGMGVDAVDVDDDGDLDLLVVNLDGESDSFFRNRGRFFGDDTASAGLRTASRPFTRFGAAFADFDNDGYLDLFEANGRVGLQSERYSSDPYAEPSLLFHGFAGPRFEEVKPRGGTAQPLIATSRAAAFGDIDNDGGIDIVVVNRDSRPFVLHNVVKPRGHWILLRVLDEHGRDAYGARVTVKVGSRSIRRDVRAAYSYLASNDPRVHVGLGQETAAHDVTVRWPDGTREAFGDLPADRIATLRRKR
ncbi:MAG TPA: CRTAC1 family protein [Vicinamibacterales bacterium]|nr:CRTAC1 family protein [Vicinamibacterales bacterium]